MRTVQPWGEQCGAGENVEVPRGEDIQTSHNIRPRMWIPPTLVQSIQYMKLSFEV